MCRRSAPGEENAVRGYRSIDRQPVGVRKRCFGIFADNAKGTRNAVRAQTKRHYTPLAPPGSIAGIAASDSLLAARPTSLATPHQERGFA